MKKLLSLLSVLLISANVSFAQVPVDAMIAAIKNKDAAKLKEAISTGADVNYTFEHKLNWTTYNQTIFSKFTPLMLATTLGFRDGVLILLKAGADVNATSNGTKGMYKKCEAKAINNVAAINLAAEIQNVSIIKLLFLGGADKNHKLVIKFVKACRNLSDAKTFEMSPKQIAKYHANDEIVQVLKEAGTADWSKGELPSE